MLKLFLRKLLIAIVATLTFSVIFSYFSTTPGEGQLFTFGGLFGFIALMSAPMYILGGIPVSIMIDRYWKWPSLEILIYALCGALLMLPYSFIVFRVSGGQYIVMMMFGASAAIIFYFVKGLLHKLFNKYGF
ncbi:hypothetical protein [Solibacillus sp. CAU 1738]|uniref:hypothetical protein n=1 Tax=Solibacillus sp. CAU 1738 TaxID=3140363 RepID=UPI0032605D63